MTHFEKVKDFLIQLEYDIVYEDSAEELVIVEKPTAGIVNLVVDCEAPILVIEQYLFDIQNETLDMFKELLKKNREIIHGAFVLDSEGKKLLFRDTLQLENLDINELEGSLNSLSLLLGEYFSELLDFAK